MIRIGREIQCLPYAGFFFLVELRIFFFTNERPGIWSCDLRANERPRQKLYPMAHTDRQTHGHGDSMTESAQWADSVKSLLHRLHAQTLFDETPPPIWPVR